MAVMRPGRSAEPRARDLAPDPSTGLIAGARQVPSPNCDERPPGVEPDLIILHGISLPPGDFGGPWIDRLFTNTLPAAAHPYFAEVADLRVSAHALVRRDGEVVQYVPCHLRAWHAGASSWEGRERCNDYSIGIEIEGTDSAPYEDVQYVVVARLVAELCRAYAGLSIARVVGHSDVAPGRKTDPGVAFDWPRLHTEVRRAWELGA